MENIVKKIFFGLQDSDMHSEFIKFGKGIFENRYLLEGKKQKDKRSIKTSHEFANFFVRMCLEKSSGNVNIKGVIISTSDIKKDCNINIEHVKKYMGIKQYSINTSIQPEQIISLMEKYPRAFYALSFNSGNCELKIKARPPKNGKPTTKENEPNADFCSLKTNDKEIIDDLFFDFPDFNEIKVKHTIEINEIVVPKDIKDPRELRELSKRKGVIKRIVKIDGKEYIKEREFVA